jgi:acyl-CoA synthetase (AMP-forming)/AMP-acid ligase II
VVVNTFDPQATADLIAAHRITSVALAPTIIFMMSEGVEGADYSSLRSVVYGGQPMTPSTLARATAMFGECLIQMYGMTECAGPVVQLDPEDHRGELLASAGRPYPWIEVAVHDPLTGAPLPPRVQGEVWTRSRQFTTGYWNRPDATAELVTDEGWLRTGDAGYLDEGGYLFLTDRIKDLIITGGENVYPAEVERIIEQHPAVRTAAVIGIPDEKWGEAVTAIVELQPGAQATGAEILSWTRGRISGFRRPQQIIVRDALPRNASGKVLRRELRDPYWSGRSRRIG